MGIILDSSGLLDSVPGWWDDGSEEDQHLGLSGAGAENPRLFKGGMNRAPPRLLSLRGITIYCSRSIAVLLGLLPAVEKTQAARTKPEKQLAWDHMPSVESP
jgi:hypothetical protein